MLLRFSFGFFMLHFRGNNLFFFVLDFWLRGNRMRLLYFRLDNYRFLMLFWFDLWLSNISRIFALCFRLNNKLFMLSLWLLGLFFRLFRLRLDKMTGPFLFYFRFNNSRFFLLHFWLNNWLIVLDLRLNILIKFLHLFNNLVNNDNSFFVVFVDSVNLSVLSYGKRFILLIDSWIDDIELLVFWLLYYLILSFFDLGLASI